MLSKIYGIRLLWRSFGLFSKRKPVFRIWVLLSGLGFSALLVHFGLVFTLVLGNWILFVALSPTIPSLKLLRSLGLDSRQAMESSFSSYLARTSPVFGL